MYPPRRWRDRAVVGRLGPAVLLAGEPSSERLLLQIRLGPPGDFHPWYHQASSFLLRFALQGGCEGALLVLEDGEGKWGGLSRVPVRRRRRRCEDHSARGDLLGAGRGGPTLLSVHATRQLSARPDRRSAASARWGGRPVSGDPAIERLPILAGGAGEPRCETEPRMAELRPNAVPDSVGLGPVVQCGPRPRDALRNESYSGWKPDQRRDRKG